MEFTEKQINILSGVYTAIARSANVSPSYVRYIVMGERRTNTKKAKEVANKAQAIVETLSK